MLRSRGSYGYVGTFRNRCEPWLVLGRVIATVAGAVAAVAGLLSALVAAGIIHGVQPPPARASSQSAPTSAVLYSTEGSRLRLGQCFNLETGLAQCGEEDLALPERQVGLLALQNGAEVSVFGVRSLADYDALDALQLSGRSYTATRTVPLEASLLLAVRTHQGSYAKMWVSIVQTPDFTLKMTTYRVGSAAG